MYSKAINLKAKVIDDANLEIPKVQSISLTHTHTVTHSKLGKGEEVGGRETPAAAV